MSADEIIHSVLSRPAGLLVVILLVLTLPSLSVSALWAFQEKRESDRDEIIMTQFFQMVDHNTTMRERAVEAFRECVAEMAQIRRQKAKERSKP